MQVILSNPLKLGTADLSQVVARLCRQDPSRSADAQSVPPSGAWEHVTASALAALSCTNVRMFHKALTMAQVRSQSAS